MYLDNVVSNSHLVTSSLPEDNQSAYTSTTKKPQTHRVSKKGEAKVPHNCNCV